MTELALQPDEIERRRRERSRRLSTIDIPALRTIGTVIICIGVFLNNHYFLGQSSMRPVLLLTFWALIYCALSWMCLWFFYDRVKPVDLSLVFLTIDVPLMAVAIYLSGAEQSWLFFIMLTRVADQSQTTFRRAFSFALFGAVCYGGMEAWVVFVDKRPIAWSVFFAKIIFIFVMGVYVALIARTAERRRTNMRSAMTMLRDAVHKLEDQSAELRDARARAEEASAAKSEFLAHMSHEMRTPLHGVIGMLQLAIDDEASTRRARQLEMARRSAESLLATIEDILDFSKIEARKIELEPVYFSIRDLVHETMKPLGVTAAAKDLTLVASIAPDVPDSVWGDPVRIRQIIVNLVGNSIKFTEKGEVSLRVSMIDDRVKFEFRDTGIGIPEAQRERIFEPFAQADNSRSRRHGGTGLGLAIVARIVEAMGGVLRLQSTPGYGTSIAIDLPLGVDKIAPAHSARTAVSGRSVAVIEPNATSRNAIAEILRNAGVEVFAYETGDALAQRQFACVISADPAIDAQPVVLITSPLGAITDDRVRVTRPVTERELVEAIGQALGVLAQAGPAMNVKRRVNEAGLHVLVAEDEAVSQEFATEALKRLMHRVTVVGDGEAALRKLEHDNFDIVFMDVSMPKLDGLEATRRYRESERGSRTPIVALTAHSRREDRMRCLEAGMDAVLTKPIDLKQLEEVIRTLTGAEPIVNAVGGNLKLLARVSDAFSKQTPALLAQIRDAITTKDGEALYQSAHNMKGAVSNFEGDPSLDLSLMLESAGRDHDFARAEVLLGRLEPAVNALERRIAAVARAETAKTA